ncbi:MAG TPA: GUN4 domain-containing protein [Nostocaceae cyanobacterium]|nr:GUN4 domain-containing protein [Nostocaceae cyanobacterium]
MNFSKKCLLAATCGVISLFTVTALAAQPTSNHQDKAAKKPNYTRLRKLLATGKWKEADIETYKQMHLLAKNGEYLTGDEKAKFPCNHLKAIDQLWLKASKNRFGFSVQKRIWQASGGGSGFDEKIYTKFVIRVGWYTKDSTVNGGYRTINIDNLNYSLKAPQGHLPGIVMSDFGAGGGFGGASGWYFIPRTASCKL